MGYLTNVSQEELVKPPQEAPGLLDKFKSWLGTPQATAIAASLLQASGPGGGTFGQAVGRGLLGGNQLQRQAEQDQLDKDRFAWQKDIYGKRQNLDEKQFGLSQQLFDLNKQKALIDQRQEGRTAFYMTLGRPPKDNAELDAFINGTNVPEASTQAQPQVEANAPLSVDRQSKVPPNTQSQLQAPMAQSAQTSEPLTGNGGMPSSETGLLNQMNPFGDDRFARAQQAYFMGGGKAASDIISEDPNKLTKDIYKQATVEDIKSKQEAASVVPAVLDVLDEYEKTVKAASDYTDLGPIVGRVSPLYSKEAQYLKQLQGKLVPMMRTMFKFPASGFSDPDREMLERAAGGPTQDKEVILKAIERLRKYGQQTLQDLENTRSGVYGTPKRGESNNPYSKASDDEVRSAMRRSK